MRGVFGEKSKKETLKGLVRLIDFGEYVLLKNFLKMKLYKELN